MYIKWIKEIIQWEVKSVPTELKSQDNNVCDNIKSWMTLFVINVKKKKTRYEMNFLVFGHGNFYNDRSSGLGGLSLLLSTISRKRI